MAEKFAHKKSLGQHFLNSAVVPGWLADAANLKTGEWVVEYGPGTGALTQEILARGARVLALEADQRAIEVLTNKFAAEIEAGNLRLLPYDLRDLDLTTLPEITDQHFSVVANIPYYLSGQLFRKTLTSDVQPHTVVFLVQKEVAKRICVDQARGEKESLLSLSIKAYGEPTYIKTVTKGHFTPPPAVDSAIIAIRQINRDNFTTVEAGHLFNLLHLGFGQKRKQLLGNLAGHYDRAQLTHTFSTLNLPLSTRAEDVSLPQWLELSHALTTHE